MIWFLVQSQLSLNAVCGMGGPAGVPGRVLHPSLCLGYQVLGTLDLDVWLIECPETPSKMLLSAEAIGPVGL